MKKLSSNRPPVLTLAAIAIAMIALIATFGGIAIGKKKHKAAHPTVTTTTVTATTNDPGQISDNGNYDVLSASKQCDQGTAVSGGAFWGGTGVIDPQADQLQLMDIKRDGNGYTARGATDLTGSNLTVQVTCQSIK